MGEQIKTPGNIKFGDMPAEYRMKYLKMIEQKRKEDEEKKLKKLYNKSNMKGGK